MKLAPLFFAVILLAGSSAGHSQEPKSFACTFASGSAFIYDQGRFNAEPAGTMTFDIGAINAEAQTAEMSSRRGPVSLRTVLASHATHFIEVGNDGFLNVTTIYDHEPGQAEYPAAHSRHFAVLGQPLVSQFLGVCKPKT